MKILKIYFLLLGLLFVIPLSFALTQNEMLWLAISTQRPLIQDSKWLGLLYSQLRFNNEAHPWGSGIIESGIGYQYTFNKSIWLGYRWTGRNPFNGFFQENRLFEQFVFKYSPAKMRSMVIRSRLEEIQRTNQNQIALRFRQKLALEFNYFVSAQVFPLIYDELFFPLNKTDYTAHNFISQNRFFIGANINQSKQAWWEVGYINQYELHTPMSSENQMNHIISVTYSFS